MKEREEKLAAGEIVIQNRLIRWLDNYWYHYKWPTIVVAFFLFVGIVCFTQCATKEPGDVTVSYAGGYTMTAEQHAKVVEIFNAIAPDAKDEKGQMSVLFSVYSVYTEDELKKAYTDEDGKLDVYSFNNAKQVSKDHLSTFGTYVMTGESAVWLVSEYVYEVQNLQKLAVPLSELYETRPAGAYDDYAIRLSETALYQYYDALKILPEDTLIVMPQSYVWGASADDESYADFMKMYRAIVDFQKP